MSDLEGNKQVVVEYYQTAFNGNPEKAFQRLAVPGFPAVAPGRRGSTGPGVCPSWS